MCFPSRIIQTSQLEPGRARPSPRVSIVTSGARPPGETVARPLAPAGPAPNHRPSATTATAGNSALPSSPRDEQDRRRRRFRAGRPRRRGRTRAHAHAAERSHRRGGPARTAAPAGGRRRGVHAAAGGLAVPLARLERALRRSVTPASARPRSRTGPVASGGAPRRGPPLEQARDVVGGVDPPLSAGPLPRPRSARASMAARAP